jgi:hypothetical protein
MKRAILSLIIVATAILGFAQKKPAVTKPSTTKPVITNNTTGVTFKNETLGFEITVPQNWKGRKGIMADPEEGIKSGGASFSMSTDESQPEPKDWNGIVFNAVTTSDNPKPFVSVYAHKKPGQKPEDFAKILEPYIKGFGGKLISVNKQFAVGDAKGFDYDYNLFVECRYVAIYQNGTRVIVHYFFPGNDPAMFKKFLPEVDAAIKSIRFK